MGRLHIDYIVIKVPYILLYRDLALQERVNPTRETRIEISSCRHNDVGDKYFSTDKSNRLY